MAYLGQLTLALAFAASSVGFMLALRSIIRRDTGPGVKLMVDMAFWTCSFSISMLLLAFLEHEYQIIYVANHSSRDLAFHYLVAAVWGGQSGSLLLWGWLLTLFTRMSHRQMTAVQPQSAVPSTAIMLAITAFFLSLVIYVADPFERLALIPVDGQGLKPLLQTFEMIVHPPTLYLGFVGFTVPFAMFIAALWAGKLDAPMVRLMRRWVIFSWAALTVGIVLGEEWAYRELGWGGFWGWDPVENASFLPWLAGTALLHSLILTRRSGMLKTSSFLLTALTFGLCVFATLLTRSGIVQSVHSFGESPLLWFFLGLLAVSAVLTIVTLVCNLKPLRSDREIGSLFSREAIFTALIVLMLVLIITVFWGTLLPRFSKWFSANEKTWNPAAYNLATAPQAAVLMFLLSAGMVIGWGRAGTKNAPLRMIAPILAGIGAFCWAFWGADGKMPIEAGMNETMSDIIGLGVPPLLLGASTMAGVAALIAFGTDLMRAGIRVSPRTVGVFMVHIGVVMTMFGIAGAAYVEEKQVTLAEKESVEVGRYMIVYDGMEFPVLRGVQRTFRAKLTYNVKGSTTTGKLTPMVKIYDSGEQHRDVSYSPGLRDDIYAILAATNDQGAVFRLIVNPLTTWLWIGGCMITLGCVIVVLPPGWLPKKARATDAAPPPPDLVATPATCPKCDAIMQETQA